MSEESGIFSRISVDQLEHWELNPNEQDKETFNKLCEEIKEDTNGSPEDMDQPLVVVPKLDDKGSPVLKGKKPIYIVMSGNHRFDAVVELGAKTVLCKIKEDWDFQKATEKAIKRNILTGRLSDAKFTRLVNDYARKTKTDVNKIADNMGFTSQAKFFQHYKSTQKKAIEKAEQDAGKKAKEELNKLDNMTFILNKLFREYGETLENEFMFFTYGNKLHLMLQMDAGTKHYLDQILEASVDNGLDFNDLFRPILEQGVATLDGVLVQAKGEKVENEAKEKEKDQ